MAAALPRDDPRGDAGRLDLLPTWALEQKAAANRRVIAVMRQRLAAGEEAARMYQEPGLAGWSDKLRSLRNWWSGAKRQPDATAEGPLAKPHDRRLPIGWLGRPA